MYLFSANKNIQVSIIIIIIIILLLLGHIGNGFVILLHLAMEGQTLASFSWLGRKVYGFAAHIIGRNRLGQ